MPCRRSRRTLCHLFLSEKLSSSFALAPHAVWGIFLGSIFSVGIDGHGAAPVADAGANMLGHRSGRRFTVAVHKGLDDGEMLVPFLRDAVKVVTGLVVLPGNVAEGAEERFQPAQLVRQIGVAARVSNE